MPTWNISFEKLITVVQLHSISPSHPKISRKNGINIFLPNISALFMLPSPSPILHSMPLNSSGLNWKIKNKLSENFLNDSQDFFRIMLFKKPRHSKNTCFAKKWNFNIFKLCEIDTQKRLFDKFWALNLKLTNLKPQNYKNICEKNRSVQ